MSVLPIPSFFFNDTATTEIYTLSLHDALPIFLHPDSRVGKRTGADGWVCRPALWIHKRSEEHTSELQSQSNLVCRLLLEKKKKKLATSTNLFSRFHIILCLVYATVFRL